MNKMEEQIEMLTKRLRSLPRDAHLEKLKCLEEHIRECTPIQLASEKRPNVWKLLQAIGQFPRQQIKLNATWQFILEQLNRLAFEYERWPSVEEYAKEEPVDWEMHAMGVKARRLACRIAGVKCQVEAKLTVRLGGKGRVIADDGHYRSACGLTAGTHFYEVLVLEKEENKIAIGWTTRGWTGGTYLAVDGEERIKQGIYLIDGQHCITLHDTFPAGTVLGCLLNVSKKIVAFYVNGQAIELQSEVAFSPGAYYVQVYLPCSPTYNVPSLQYFNFGQLPFKYRPPEFQQLSPFWRAHSPVRYALYSYDDVISMPVFDNRVEPWFCDEKQAFVKEAIEKLLNNGQITIEKVAEEYGQLRERVAFCKETHTWRWAQVMIEMGNIPESKVNTWASLVDKIVELTADKFSLQFEHFLTPYSKLQAPSGTNTAIHRNLTILTTTNVQYVVHFYQTENWCNNLFQSLFSFFLSAFLSTDDPWTIIFVLIALQGYQGYIKTVK